MIEHAEVHAAWAVADTLHHLFKTQENPVEAWREFDPLRFADGFFSDQPKSFFLQRYNHHSEREGYVNPTYDPTVPRTFKMSGQ